MHTEDFTIFSLDMNFAKCLVTCLPHTPLVHVCLVQLILILLIERLLEGHGVWHSLTINLSNC